MTNLHAVAMGILQGVTEFLPVSSSGHLVLAEEWLGLQLDPKAMLSVNVLLHAGTLLALLIVYYQRWWSLACCLFTNDRTHKKLLLMIGIATIPAVILGVLAKDLITTVFYTPSAVALCFFVTAFLLWLGEKSNGKKSIKFVSTFAAIAIGLGQAMALLPGISRSGASISVARWFGLSRKEALNFSFLMAVPALFGAVIYTVASNVHQPVVLPAVSVLIISFIASFFASLAAILFLQRFVRRHSFVWFSMYLVMAGAVLLFW